MKNIFIYKMTVVIFSLWCIFGMSFIKVNAGCPHINHGGWQKAQSGVRTIHYFIEDGFTPTEIQQIGNAFTDWSAKSELTCIKLNFVPGTASNSEYIVHLNGAPDFQTETGFPNTQFVTNAETWIQMSDFSRFGQGNDTAFLKAMLHEIGHTMGLSEADDPEVSQASVMNVHDSTDKNDLAEFNPTSVKIICDVGTINTNPQCAPYPPGTPYGYCNLPPAEYQELEEACEANGGLWKGCRGCYSPIVIDVLGNGYNLTDGNNGLMFDLTGDGTKDKIAWTSVNSDDAWLVLDRNRNGLIDNGLELFGNYTEQPASIPLKDRNGFLALTEFDKPANGGNADGGIDSKDAVFRDLRLWQDLNHNGISEPNELKTLLELDVTAISLDYKESKRTDEFGNRFKYRAKVWDTKNNKTGRWAWDAFLVKER
jgi:hypothetical protein